MEGGAVNLYKDFFPTSLHIAPNLIAKVSLWSLTATYGIVFAGVLVLGMISGFILATILYDPMLSTIFWRLSTFANTGKDPIIESKYEVESGNNSESLRKKVSVILSHLCNFYPPIMYFNNIGRRFPNMWQLLWTETGDTVSNISPMKRRYE